jgi:hypothetical protein
MPFRHKYSSQPVLPGWNSGLIHPPIPVGLPAMAAQKKHAENILKIITTRCTTNKSVLYIHTLKPN